MSFTVEFDGILNENTDLVQMTGSSSLNKGIVVRDPASGFYSSYSGYNNTPPTRYWYYISGPSDTALWWLDVLVYRGATSGTTKTVGGYTYYRGVVVSNSGLTYSIARSYVSTSAVTITETIDQNGVVLSGGFLGSTSLNLVQEGFDGTTTTPRDFGLVVKQNGTEIVRASYRPPAQTGEGAIMTASTSKVITATSTTMEVESYGLDTVHTLKDTTTAIVVKELIE